MIFSDSRVQSASDQLDSGKIKLLSLDIFDTLLARRVPRPPDVFLRLGCLLQDKGLLGTGISPDSFAAMRYQTEYAARGLRQKKYGDREITLAEIYAQMPQQAARIGSNELVAAEITIEHEVCFANANLINLAQLAVKQGVKLALISNSYFGATVIGDLLRAKAPNLPAPDALLVSCDHRCGKRTGLMQKMIEHFAVAPHEVLHIGDDPVSDRETARELGVGFIDFTFAEDPLSVRLIEEQPIQWHARTDRYGTKGGDSGMTWLRCQSVYAMAADVSVSDKAYYTYGTSQMGPLLTGFAAWAGARLKQEQGTTLFGLTREGDFLSRLASAFDPAIPCKIMAVSRLSVTLASFAPDYPDHLEDFLTRRGFWTLRDLMAQLGFDADQATLIGDPAATLDIMPPQEIAYKLTTSPLAKELYQRSTARRQRLLKYLRAIGALENKKLFLLDLGYAATIQRGLQRIFTIEKISVQTHGLYLAAAHVSLATQQAGGIVEGFLAQNGNPNDFARAFCRSPEIVELSCMPDYGTVVDYSENGKPIFADEDMPPRQKQETAAIQRGVMDFAAKFCALTFSLPPDFCGEGWRSQMRDLATRLVVYPTADEAQLFGHWLADSDMGLASLRPLLSTGRHNLAELSAAEIIALPRRDLPWLYGIAAVLGHAKARQIAALMLRLEASESFA